MQAVFTKTNTCVDLGLVRKKGLDITTTMKYGRFIADVSTASQTHESKIGKLKVGVPRGLFDTFQIKNTETTNTFRQALEAMAEGVEDDVQLLEKQDRVNTDTL